ncbi:MAG TPA: acetyl-CoA carboxylase, carboxyltransferase subunit beta [Gemmatimonadota bacterium]|jgi:acetyl-CoA carboxylase carboxyl transferase subunit beta|nr:acetyl-CoA carboxylase, carboxyltransferase subunit beta [Gemmatimonadota bacterium]
MTWFKRDRKKIETTEKKELPGDLWQKCPACGDILYRKELAQRAWICSKCGHHFRVAADDYLEILLDPGTFEEFDADLESVDALEFVDTRPYRERLEQYRERTGRNDAVVCGIGSVDGVEVSIAVMDFNFMGGSMGSVVGEKVARAIERALSREVPLLIVSASGGARMQEGVLSLMQMAKTSTLLAALDRQGLPFVAVNTDPTTGGVTASYAMLGDVIYAEPRAQIGFAGPRVIKQTIGQDLPDEFQTAEFVLEHGFVDAVVPRLRLKRVVSRTLRWMLGREALPEES